jgi:SprT protein
MRSTQDFTAEVRKCLEHAERLYGKLPQLQIRYDLRGKAIGKAGRKNGVWYLRFNREAIEKHWDDMVKDTIPHEVAHIVCFVHTHLGGSNHNAVWQRVAISLGSTGKRCHSLEVSNARAVKRFIYRTPLGVEVALASIRHNKVQRGQARYRLKKTGETLRPEYFTQQVVTKK